MATAASRQLRRTQVNSPSHGATDPHIAAQTPVIEPAPVQEKEEEGGAPATTIPTRAEIEAQTAKLAGDEKDICATPIVLRLHVAGAPSLTLVDLPGVKDSNA